MSKVEIILKMKNGKPKKELGYVWCTRRLAYAIYLELTSLCLWQTTSCAKCIRYQSQADNTLMNMMREPHVRPRNLL